jgi:hypothetical protein
MNAFLKRPYVSAWLFVGPSGTGKTTMTFTVAEALGATQAIGGGIYHLPARACDLEAITRVVNQCHYTPLVGCPWSIVIIDECDTMSRAAQEALLSHLDCAAPPPQTIWLMTANGTENLHDRFVSRLRRVQFSTDNLLRPGVAYLRSIWRKEIRAAKLKTKPQPPDFEVMLRMAKFNMREALMPLETELLAPTTASKSAPKPSSHSKRSTDTGIIYTIGGSPYTAESLVEVYRSLNASLLIDCNATATAALRTALKDEYLWAGDKLSSQVGDKRLQDGIAWICSLSASGKIALLLYYDEVPGECERHTVIAQALLKRGVDAVHVYADQLITASELQASIDQDREYTYRVWRLPRVV